MAKKPEKDSRPELEEKVWNAIAAFEQILEAMPTDRASLDALAHAYEQVGDHTKAKDYLIRLGNVIIQENDADAGQEILEKIEVNPLCIGHRVIGGTAVLAAQLIVVNRGNGIARIAPQS